MLKTIAKATRVSAPSRLHFGLFSIGGETKEQFGGAGLMIDRPRSVIATQPSNRLKLPTTGRERLLDTVERWFQFNAPSMKERGLESADQIPIEMSIESTPLRHSGLGSGTQFAMATALALTIAFDLPMPSVEELAIISNRGKRSGIGSHGFLRGGFLIDRGKDVDESLAPLEMQLTFPDNWRIVTVIDRTAKVMFGESEKVIFQSLSPTTPIERKEMIDLMKVQIAPALVQRDFDSFSQGIYEFGRRSGLMYSSVQGGPFNGPHIESTVGLIRDFGIQGTGQSSWGPCVYAFADSETSAESLAGHLRVKLGRHHEIQICSADNQGVRIET